MKLRGSTCTRKCMFRVMMPFKDYLPVVRKEADEIFEADGFSARGPDRRTNPCRLQTRVDMETDYAFRTLCHERNKTVSDMLLELVRNAVARAGEEATDEP